MVRSFHARLIRAARRLRTGAASFAADRSGNFAMITALAALPTALAMGGAVDLAGFYRVETQIQNSSDAAVLAAATLHDGSMAERKAEADAVFGANRTSGNFETDLAKDGDEYVYSVRGTFPTTFLHLAQIPQLPLTIESRSVAEDTILDVALVVDVSGSTQGERIREMKKAVANFLAGFETGNDTVRVSVVPFNGQVRVNPSEFAPSFSRYTRNPYNTFDCTAILDPVDRQICQNHSIGSVAFTECETLRSNRHRQAFPDTQDYDYQLCGPNVPGFRLVAGGFENDTYGQFSGYGYVAEYRAYLRDGYRTIDRRLRRSNGPWGPFATIYRYDRRAGVDPAFSYFLLRSENETWDGCLLDRTAPFDASAESPPNPQRADAWALRYPRARCAETGQRTAMALSSNLTAVNTFVQGLQAHGATNITLGVQWGMESLTPAPPLTGSREEAFKAMIVLTDGKSTHNRWNGTVVGWQPGNQKQLDSRTVATCDNAKKLGIEIYTINLIDGDAAMLEACASEGEFRYSEIDNASELTGTFEAISSSLKAIRLTH